MANINRVDYYAEDKYNLISQENLLLYERYLKSNSIKNKDTFDSSYGIYQRNFTFFLVFLAEKYDNIGLYSDDFIAYGADIVEDYMAFCINKLKNSKKTVNNKVNAICSFYKWSTKRRLIQQNPLADRVERIPRATEEKIIKDYFLSQEQIDDISSYLIDSGDKRFDFQDVLLWFIFLDSANRLGAIEQLSISKLNQDRMIFEGVVEKEARKVDVAFSKETLQLILWWIEQRKYDYDLLTEDALFITKYKGKWNRMARRTIQTRISKIGTIIGIDDLHPHSIRKSAASNMLDRGADSYLISRYLNHKSMEVLKNYIKPQNASDLRQQIEKQIKDPSN